MLQPTTKRYVVNSNGLNNYGFRVISQGVDQSQYNNNKIMLWMHYRPTGSRKDEVLALGIGDDVKVDKNGVMDFQPMFDTTDAFAKSIFDKYESGVYNMFSLCALPLEVSTEPDDMIAGQSGPTITKSILKEISAVDIGGNPDAYGIALCDENGELIKLADAKFITKKPKDTDMKLEKIGVGELLPLIKLADDTTEALAIAKLKEFIALADANSTELVQLRDAQTNLTAERDAAKTKLVTTEQLFNEIKLADLKTISVLERKVTALEFDELVELSDKNYDKVKKVMDKKAPNPSIKETLTNRKEDAKGELAELVKLSYQELDKSGKLVKLKDLSMEDFKIKFKERYGVDYKGN
jgi:hypothetical protein